MVLVITKNPTPIIIRTIIKDTATAAIVPLLLTSRFRGDADNEGSRLDPAGGEWSNSLLGFGGPSGWFNMQVCRKIYKGS